MIGHKTLLRPAFMSVCKNPEELEKGPFSVEVNERWDNITKA